MSREKFTLYVDSRFLSPYAMSVYVALVEKGISPDIRKINLASREQHGPEYAEISVTRRVPTLIHGDFSLSESSAITEYLDEILPSPDYAAIYPNDIRSKAKARQIQAALRSDFMPLREERPTEVLFVAPVEQELSPTARESVEKLISIADKCVAENARDLFGEWCVADTDLAIMLNRLVMNGDQVPEKLREYALCQWERPSVQQWLDLGGFR